MKKLYLLIVFCLMAMFISGCTTKDNSEDLEKAKAASEALTITNLIVTENFTLPTTINEATIEWQSNDSAIVIDGANATVNRGTVDKNVNLTANLKVGSVTYTKVFKFVVTGIPSERSDASKLIEAKTNLKLESLEVSDNFTLPLQGLHESTVTWVSDNEAIAVNGENATVTRGVNDVNVTLTATITVGAETAEKTFVVKVLKLATVKTITVQFNVYVPNNTPTDSTIAIAGNLGGDTPQWAPDNAWGKATKVTNSLYTFEYQVNVIDQLEIEYKWTRGNWDTVEKKADNTDVDNRKVTVTPENDTFVINDTIAKWADLDAPTAKTITVKFNVRVPNNTPTDSTIAIAGNLGGETPQWAPDNAWGKATKVSNILYTFEYQIEVLGTLDIEYKWTRGNWDTVEKKADNTDVDNRKVRITDGEDVFVIEDTVAKWADLDAPTARTVTVKFNLTVPSNTPEDAVVAIAGSFGGDTPQWQPDNVWGKATKVTTTTYTFEYQIQVLGDLEIQYKWTRGSWDKVEKKADNTDVDNRVVVITDGDDVFTINDTVVKWADL